MKRLMVVIGLALTLAACSFTVQRVGPDTWRISLDLPTISPTATETIETTATATPTLAPTSIPTLIPTPASTSAPTPTPETAKCWGRVADGPLRVRSGPSLDAEILGALKVNQTVALEAAELDAQNNVWYRIWWLPDTDGYIWAAYVTVGESADCSLIPGPRLGLHLTMTVNGGAIAPLFSHLGTLKATSLNGHLLAAAKAVNPQIVTIYRSTRFPDCPPDEMNASQWLDQVSRDWPPDADYYEWVNECILPTSRWISLSIQAMQWAERRGLCLLLFSFAVGQPEVAQWRQLRPVFDYALEHPCQSGRLFGIALHAYTEGRLLSDPWVFSRYQTLCASIDRIYCDRLPLYLTEVGLSDMATGPVDCGRWLAFARDVEANLAGSQVDGYHLWSVGYGTGWIDTSPCLGGL